MNDSSLHEVFSKNRTEEIGYDVWNYFVVPPFYNRLDLQTARKPRLIIGGRGCGKTMLLRYLSHQSSFSANRAKIPDAALSHIGLYWKADTQFCNAMVKRGILDDTWEGGFNHFTALILGMEVIDSLYSIADSSYPKITRVDIDHLNFSRLHAFDPRLPASANELYEKLEEHLWEFIRWVSDVKKVPEPFFLPGRQFILGMISIIRSALSPLREAIFYVYLDEYENLCNYQQEIINTWLKHSEAPLIFNLAMKRNAFETKKTLGKESLSDIHDFRQHDLEEYILDDNFEVFAGEILFLQLSFVRTFEIPIDIEDLRDPNALLKRQTDEYAKRILSAVQRIFPDISQERLAQLVFEDKALSSQLKSQIKKALDHRGSTISIDKFFRENLPEASIITPALLYRKRMQPEEIVEEMNKLEGSKENRFSGETNWIHNNFIACLLQLYAPYSRACPFYAGFNTFCKLSRGNIRHFLELCHKSFYRSITESGLIELPTTFEKQAVAARQASTAFLGEIRTFGRHGNQLHMFVLRLGSLFSLVHQRPTQSEPELSHFSITRGAEELSRDDNDFLREATKWSVIYEHRETKMKDEFQPESIEYVLNPIYAPYFHITYRKKRKLELSTENVICLIRGNLDEFKKMMREYSSNWSIEPMELDYPLFLPLELGSKK